MSCLIFWEVDSSKPSRQLGLSGIDLWTPDSFLFAPPRRPGCCKLVFTVRLNWKLTTKTSHPRSSKKKKYNLRGDPHGSTVLRVPKICEFERIGSTRGFPGGFRFRGPGFRIPGIPGLRDWRGSVPNNGGGTGFAGNKHPANSKGIEKSDR